MTTPLARHHGWSGGISYGLGMFAILAVFCAFGGAALWLITRDVNVAGWFALRLALFCAAASVAAVFCRALGGGSWDRHFVTLKLVRGDSGVIGALLGAIVAGWWTPTPWTGNITGQGASFPIVGEKLDLTGPLLDGTMFNLTDHRGHPVLIDFWATWCGPCIKEMPNLRTAHEKYEPKGLRIVSVSLDEHRPALDNFLKKHPTPWPQIFFSEKDQLGFSNPIAKKYNITTIPQILLVDAEGKVAATALRGPGIERAVATPFGESPPTSVGLTLWESLLKALFVTPWWLQAVCVIGGAIVVCGLEAGVRKVIWGSRAA